MKAATSLMNLRVDRPLDRNRSHDRGDDRRDRGDERKQSDKPAVQPGAGPRRPSRRAKAAKLHRNQDDQDDDDQAVARPTGSGRRSPSGMMGVKPAKTRNVASARTKAAPTTITPKRPVGRLSSRSAEPRALIVVVPVKYAEPKAAQRLAQRRVFSASVADSQRCGLAATLRAGRLRVRRRRCAARHPVHLVGAGAAESAAPTIEGRKAARLSRRSIRWTGFHPGWFLSQEYAA